MTFLRIILLAVLLYYGIKILAGWIFRSDNKRPHVDKRRPAGRDAKRYSDLTDQRIEDADYEEIETEEKP